MADVYEDEVSGNAVVLPSRTPWQAFTPVLKGSISDPTLGTGGLAIGRWRQNYDEYEYEVFFKSGTGATVGSGFYYFAPPNGGVVDFAQTIDTAEMTNIYMANGVGVYNNSGVAAALTGLALNGTTNGIFWSDPITGLLGSAAPTASWWNNSGAGDSLYAKGSVPIVGLSAYTAYGAGLATSVKPGLVSGYDEGSFVASATGPFTTPPNLTVEYVRVGKQVTLTVPATNVAASVAAVASLSMANLPAGLRPTNITDFTTVCIINAGAFTTGPGKARIGPTGGLIVSKDPNDTSFTGSSSCGWNAFSITYRAT